MNLSMKQKQTHRHREQTCGCQGGGWVGEGQTGSLELADAEKKKKKKIFRPRKLIKFCLHRKKNKLFRYLELHQRQISMLILLWWKGEAHKGKNASGPGN